MFLKILLIRCIRIQMRHGLLHQGLRVRGVPKVETHIFLDAKSFELFQYSHFDITVY